MSAAAMTPEEVRTVGLRALATALGPDGMVRFLVQFDRGSGDYTAARQAWVDQLDLTELQRVLEQQRRERTGGAAGAHSGDTGPVEA